MKFCFWSVFDRFLQIYRGILDLGVPHVPADHQKHRESTSYTALPLPWKFEAISLKTRKVMAEKKMRIFLTKKYTFGELFEPAL